MLERTIDRLDRGVYMVHRRRRFCLVPRPLLALGLGLLLALLRLHRCRYRVLAGRRVLCRGRLRRLVVREAELLVVLELELLVVGKRRRVALVLDVVDVDEAVVGVVCPALALAALLRRRLVGVLADLRVGRETVSAPERRSAEHARVRNAP